MEVKRRDLNHQMTLLLSAGSISRVRDRGLPRMTRGMIWSVDRN